MSEFHVQQRIERYLDHLYEEEPEYVNEVRSLVLWVHFLAEEMAESGFRYDGCVFRQRHSDVTLTVKVNEGGTPLVAFTSSGTTTGCIQMFLRALRANKVRWIRDKYPWT